jgi:hypothetical protein
VTLMSKKNDRAWFVCPQWTNLVAGLYADDIEAGRALNVNPRVLAKLRSQTPVAKSTLRAMLRRVAEQRGLGTAVDELVVDTRSR